MVNATKGFQQFDYQVANINFFVNYFARFLHGPNKNVCHNLFKNPIESLIRKKSTIHTSYNERFS